MKRNLLLLCLLTVLSTLHFQLSTAFAQGTAFTYQGRLNDNGSPTTRLYDMRFSVWDAATNGTRLAGLTNSAVGVSGGFFTVTLDFGPGVFTGPDRWLNISVCPNRGTAGYTVLSPAIQGLNQKVESQNASLRAESEDLRQQLAELKALVSDLTTQLKGTQQ